MTIDNLKRIIVLMWSIVGIVSLVSAQSWNIDDIEGQIESTLLKEGIAPSSTDIRITDTHTSEHNGVTHVYFTQVYQGIPILGTESNLAYNRSHDILHTSRIITDIVSIIDGSPVAVEPQMALQSLAQSLDLPFAKSQGKLLKSNEDDIRITNLPYARGEVIIVPVWVKNKEGRLQRGWRIDLDANVSADHYDAIVSAVDGSLISLGNFTVSCAFDHAYEHEFSPSAPYQVTAPALPAAPQFPAAVVVDGSQYRVFAPPIESPIHGERTLESEPTDEVASPFGWHDTNNVAGAEFTITRGNNAHAYQDPEDDDDSNGDEPDGGSDLIFDFPFSRDSFPEGNLDADVTNLFYWNNYLHDWSYKFGFNEAAGNFQENNFGRGGRSGDHVNAQTLDGGDTGNANFSAPRDGDFGRMQMYKWIVGNDLSVLTPASIAGTYSTGSAAFGPSRTNSISGTAVIARDGTGERTDACEDIINGPDISGNIALIDRGTCDFSFKVFQAQEVGAIAALICNNLDDAPLITMSGGDNADQVTIPSLFLSKEDCRIIKDEIGQQVQLRLNEAIELSSSFDNGIVSHEYGHGITLRLAGGASNSGCLNNDEQVGEGWSDFFGMVVTQQPDDTRDKSRGIGNYVIGQNPAGFGIRRYRYNTDMSVNPQTHSHIRPTTLPHPLGEIWAGSLWDMYWDFIEVYGYDPTWEDRESGNFKAVQIVIDGVKLQGCNAGLLAARDAIIEADILNYFGENECLIWKAFARRGLGVDAVGGDPDDRRDNSDGFALPSSCSDELIVEKTMTSTVDVGDEIQVELTIKNYKSNLDGLTLTDIIPDGLEVVVSATDEFIVDGDKLTFDIGTAVEDQVITKSYRLSTEGMQSPDFQVFDNFEGRLNFDRERSNTVIASWNVTTVRSAGGLFSLRVLGDTLSGEAYAITKTPFEITDSNKLLKFQNRFESELGIDGGVVEVSKDAGTTWELVTPDQFLVNGYNDVVTFDSRFTQTTPAFSGTDTRWAPCVIDLSNYAGETILIRFRYIQQRFRQLTRTEGWLIDNFEIYDRKEFRSPVMLFQNDEIIATDTASVFINSDARRTPTETPVPLQLSLELSPNPTTDLLQLTYNATAKSTAQITIINSSGQILLQRQESFAKGVNNLDLNVSNLPSGIYTLTVVDGDQRTVASFAKVY